MVFLVGVMRSGTNWLQRMLASRPEIFSVPAETLLFEWVNEFGDHFQHGNIGSFTVGRPYVQRSDFLDRMRAFCDAVLMGYAPTEVPERLLERSPQHVNHVGLISDIYPDAYVVHIIRDGRDVARSLLNMDFGPSTLPAAATEWKGSIESARRNSVGLQHYIEVRYEDLLAAPEREMPRLFRGLGLSSPDGQLERVLEEGRIRFNVDRRSPVIASGKWKESFSDEDAMIFDEIAGDLLTELGYSRSVETPGGHRPEAERQRVPATRPGRWGLRRRRGAEAKDPIRQDLADKSGLVDTFMGALVAADGAQIRSLLTDDCQVHLISGEEEWRGDGAEALDRLETAVTDDPALRGRQLRVRQHPGQSQWVLVASFQVADAVQHRLIILGFSADLISALWYYTLT